MSTISRSPAQAALPARSVLSGWLRRGVMPFSEALSSRGWEPRVDVVAPHGGRARLAASHGGWSPRHAGACASRSLCFVVGHDRIFTSTNPSAPATKWKRDWPGFPLSGLSCPSPSLCVGVDGADSVYIGTPDHAGPHRKA